MLLKYQHIRTYAYCRDEDDTVKEGKKLPLLKGPNLSLTLPYPILQQSQRAVHSHQEYLQGTAIR